MRKCLRFGRSCVKRTLCTKESQAKSYILDDNFQAFCTMMNSRHRLQQARAHAGYASPSDAARALREINKNTLISHENGNRPLSRKAAEKYGRLFGVDPGWLLFNGDGAEAAPVNFAPSPVT